MLVFIHIKSLYINVLVHIVHVWMCLKKSQTKDEDSERYTIIIYNNYLSRKHKEMKDVDGYIQK